MASEYTLSMTASEIEERLEKVEDAVISPTTATVGQALVVTEVDENSKPTAWGGRPFS